MEIQNPAGKKVKLSFRKDLTDGPIVSMTVEGWFGRTERTALQLRYAIEACSGKDDKSAWEAYWKEVLKALTLWGEGWDNGYKHGVMKL